MTENKYISYCLMSYAGHSDKAYDDLREALNALYAMEGHRRKYYGIAQITKVYAYDENGVFIRSSEAVEWVVKFEQWRSR